MIDEIKHSNIIENELDSLSGRITYRTNSTEQPLENNQNFKIRSNKLLIDNGNFILNKNIHNYNNFKEKIPVKINNSVFSNDSNNLSTILNTSNLSSNRYLKEKKRKNNKIKKYKFKKGNITKIFVSLMITISIIIFIILFIFF